MDSTTTNEAGAVPACASSSSTSVLDGEPEIVRAAHEGDEERALELLQEETVDPNTRTCKGAYPLLHVAALSDLPLLAARLLELGALPDALDRDGYTALHYAVTWEAIDTIQTLIKGGASVNALTRDNIYYLNGSIPMVMVGGRTALHLAAEKGYVECVQLLIEGGVDPELKDYSGRTAYDLAVNKKHWHVAGLLKPDTVELSRVPKHVAQVPPNDVEDRNGVRNRIELVRKQEKRDYRAHIRENYRPLHSDVYTLHESMFEDSFLRAINDGSEAALRSLLEEVHPGIYSFPMLKLSFCDRLLEELDHLEQSGLSLKRPNSMNAYGVILSDVGFKEMMHQLMRRYVCPLATLLYAEQGGDSLDRLHSFVVKYKIGEDLDLKEHVDDSEVTLNVSLGKSFAGGDLDFNGVANTPTSKNDHFTCGHSPGVAVLHLGSHWHSALKISECRRGKKTVSTPKCLAKADS
ncbi:ankyrin repeat-containing protein [Acanthamoeba castellanii str. Neff]|uniref:Ankyrin repeat-containing protein n=1 Tax=Acanthamoeba castellanii (strain ATCC 30010 / Neff) TaxID=1257118 RepID=L8GHT3_ACACF|nr:ankyrin repeat-containing protein [Acanthamoeba castellanii str. Neff]ELR12605.1 ankyrin repeat-containing protein [Acanthamoeba castellanii str. Neff]